MLYIITHTDFKEHITEGNATILSKCELNGTYHFPVIEVHNELEPIKHAYGEGVQIKHIYDNATDDFIGICQYRRYLQGVNGTEQQVILPQPLQFNLHEQYSLCHNSEDLTACYSIIDNHFSKYAMDYKQINLLFPCNMFVMPLSDFKEYYDFTFGVLDLFNQQYELKTDEDVIKHVEQNLNKYSDKRVIYQSRLQSFLLERLGTIFFLKHYKESDYITRPIELTGEKIGQ